MFLRLVQGSRGYGNTYCCCCSDSSIYCLLKTPWPSTRYLTHFLFVLNQVCMQHDGKWHPLLLKFTHYCESLRRLEKDKFWWVPLSSYISIHVTVCPCFCPHPTFLHKCYSGWLTVNSTQHQIQIQRFLWTLPPALTIACVLILITNLLLYITGGSPLIVPWHKIWGESTKEMIFMTISASRSRFVMWASLGETAILHYYGASFQI